MDQVARHIDHADHLTMRREYVSPRDWIDCISAIQLPLPVACETESINFLPQMLTMQPDAAPVGFSSAPDQLQWEGSPAHPNKAIPLCQRLPSLPRFKPLMFEFNGRAASCVGPMQ
jgi:hypothetical protein